MIFFRQFKNAFVYVLLAAAIVSWLLGQTTNILFIFLVLLINATIGAVKNILLCVRQLLYKKMVSQYAAVIRDGVPYKLKAMELVSGATDLNRQQCQALLINEPALTGESIASNKQTDDKASLLERVIINAIVIGSISFFPGRLIRGRCGQ